MQRDEESWCGEVKKGRDRSDSDTLGLDGSVGSKQLIDSDCPTSLKAPQLSHTHSGVHRSGFHIPFAPRILTGRVLHRFDVVARLRGLARRRGFRRQALEFSDPHRLMGCLVIGRWRCSGSLDRE
jgi:hypothetical protein